MLAIPLTTRPRYRSIPLIVTSLIVLAALLLFAPRDARAQERGAVWPTLSYTAITGGLDDPLYMTHAGDGSGRLFIVEQRGTIRIWDGSALLPTPFLDISGKVAGGSERGLLGLAFPPDYATDGHFYINYTNLNGDTVVARYQTSADPQQAEPASEEIVLTVAQPFSNHNGGHIVFGPDGYLYIGMGDGGASGDPQDNAQDLGTLLGALLRIDVESGATPYAIPADNPFVGVPGAREEIWALGLRNPWRYSFDRATGDLYIGDVGQNEWEEIDVQPAGYGGANYGWRCYEGSHPYNLTGCGPVGDYDFPVVEYPHSAGCSVTGGYTYRGTAYPQMEGLYLYGDYCSGRVWGLQNMGGMWQSLELDDTPYSISSFGEDEAGALYLLSYSSGTLYQIVQSGSLIPARTPILLLATRPLQGVNLVRGIVPVRNDSMQPISNASVTIRWRRPGGGTIQQSATTDAQGIARFTTVGGNGLYLLTIDEVTVPGHFFDRDNSVLRRALVVPPPN